MTGYTSTTKAEAALQRRIALINSRLRRQNLMLRIPVNAATRQKHGVCLYKLPRRPEDPAALLQACVDLDALERLLSQPSASWVEALNV